MIPRERLINKLIDHGLRLADFGVRGDFFKGTVGGVMRIASIPRHDLLEDEFVRQQLHFAGCDRDQIETFIANNQSG
jgi:hypothetical protein